MNRREFIKRSAGAYTALTLAAGAQAQERPNLLFIMTDHQRADSLSMVQAGVEVTPNLNRLAQEASAFTRAYNASPICAPARTALATGLYPTRTGIVFNDWKGTRARDCKPIHQYLHEAGYQVGHIGVDHIRLKPTLRERVPFALWVGGSEYNRYCKENEADDSAFRNSPLRHNQITEYGDGRYTRKNYSNPKATTYPFAAEHFKDAYWARRAEEFLRNPPAAPFALFVYLWAPHPPLRCPEPYMAKFSPDKLKLPPNIDQPAHGEPANRQQGIARLMGEGTSMEGWRKAWSAHLGLVNLADACVGGILKTLDEAGLAENTITLFTSDHGEHLGQHRMYQKMEMYEQAVHVPLLIRVPGGRVQQFDTPVSHLDIVPTLLDVLGIMPTGDFDGISLKKSIETGDAPPDRPIFSQYSGNPSFGDLRRSVVTRRYKYIWDPRDIPELYDLQEDPLEMTNIAADPAYASVAERMHKAAKEWAANHGDWVGF